MDNNSSKALDSLKPSRIIIPILIGLGVIIWMFVTDDSFTWQDIVENIKNANVWWVILAIFALFARDLGYIYRIRHLTNKELSWMSSIYVIILWEFASALTPSVVGGTAVVVFIISKEGIPFGKSLAYVMLTAVLDNLFFVIASAIVILSQMEVFPARDLPIFGYNLPVKNIFIISASLIASYTFIMAYGIFGKPQAIKWLLTKLTSNRLLKRFHEAAVKGGDDIMLASNELRGMTRAYWAKATISTLFIWSARYLIVNCLIAAFMSGIGAFTHVTIFARHLIMWIAMLVSPTPGSAGVAEYTFPIFFGEFTTNITDPENMSLAIMVGVIWRILTYFLYLLLGVFFVPRWVTKVFGKTAKEGTEKAPEV